MKRSFHELPVDQDSDEAIPAVVFIVQDLWEEGDPPQAQEPHPYAHAHFVVSGSVRVDTLDESAERTVASKSAVAGQHVMVDAHKFHRLTGKPGTITQCIHVLREHDTPQNLLDPKDVPAGATALSVARPITSL